MDLRRCKLAKGPFKPEARKCDWCAGPLTGRRRRWCSDAHGRAWWENHDYSTARKIVKRRDKYKCVKCGSKKPLEVNHIVPCIGKHSKQGCWHHQDNLETLCIPCHRGITKQQRENGDFRTKPRRKKR